MASVATMLLAITLILGLRIGDVPPWLNGPKVAKEAGDETKFLEIQARSDEGVAALIITACSRSAWRFFCAVCAQHVNHVLRRHEPLVREVVETYALDGILRPSHRANKRRNFPAAVFGMLTILFIAGLGAASDWSIDYPVHVERAANWVTPHLIAACVGIVITIAAFYFQAVKLQQQGEHIARIMDEVGRVRKEQGLNE